MPHRRTLDRVSRPGLRFQGWRRLPAGSRIAVVILANYQDRKSVV